jgi:hypothetical protein
MAKSKPCVLIGNTRWGYCFTPEEFPSVSEAKRVARENVREGYWWSYRIFPKKAA